MEKISVLLVDDKPQNLLALEDQLEEFDLHIVKANSGEEALKLSVREKFALIILDVQMPGMDGFETAEMLRSIKKTAHIPIIFATAISKDEKHAFKGYQSGAVDFLFKPIDAFVLKSKVKIFIELYQQRKQLEELNKNLEAKVAEKTQELQMLTDKFRLFVPKQFIERVEMKGTTFLESGYFHQEKFTILFSDIRSYTNISEKMTPQENFEFLNSYLQLMEPPIAHHHGFVDKFIGDGIMALFDQEASAEQALRAAIEMHHQLQGYNATREEQGETPISFGVGINTGQVVVGALGSPNRLDSTVVGDPVNIASRLEQLTKKYRSRILISQHTYQELPEGQFHTREIDTLRLKGKEIPILVYEVFDGDPPDVIEKKLSILGDYREGMEAYKQLDFIQASGAFIKCLETFPHDPVAVEYLKRSGYFQKHPPQVLDEDLENTLSEENPTNRRKHPRLVFDTYTYIHVKDRERIEGKLLDVSRSGVRVLVSGAIYAGDLVTLEIVTKDHQDHSMLSSIKMLSQVVWKKRNPSSEDESLYAIGVEFIVISAEQEIIFQSWLADKVVE